MQAYGQGNELSRKIDISPNPCLPLANDQLLRIVRSLYGLGDSGDAWSGKLRLFLASDLYFLLPTAYPCFICEEPVAPHWSASMYVYYIVFDGTTDMTKTSDTIAGRIPSKERQPLPFKSSRSQVERVPQCFKMHQTDSAAILVPLHTAVASFQTLRRVCLELAGLANTRLDLLPPMNTFSQVTDASFSQAYVLAINAVHRRAAENRDLGLTFARLDVDTLHVVVYSDA